MWHYEPIDPEDLRATDLLEEARLVSTPVEAYRLTLDDSPEAAEVLYVPAAGRIGIAWGADAVWGDAQTAEAGMAAWMRGDLPE